MSRKINKLDIHRIYKQSSYFKTVIAKCLLGVGLMIRVVDSGSLDPEFKPHLAVELILVGLTLPVIHSKSAKWVPASCVGVATCPGLCPIAKETALRQHQHSGQSVVPMDGWIARYHDLHHQKWKEVMFSPLSVCYLQNRRFFFKDIGQSILSVCLSVSSKSQF